MKLGLLFNGTSLDKGQMVSVRILPLTELYTSYNCRPAYSKDFSLLFYTSYPVIPVMASKAARSIDQHLIH